MSLDPTPPPSGPPSGSRDGRDHSGFLDGQLLVAMPSMEDPRFSRAVIYLCAHSGEGAMGLIINQRVPNLKFRDLLAQLNVAGAGEQIDLTRSDGNLELDVHMGGPVEAGRGFVLHSADYFVADSTLPIDQSICLTATVEILQAIAAGRGPKQALLALGYAGWAPGQLELEIQANGWLICPAEPELVFDRDLEGKYERSLKKLGIDPSFLVSHAGRA